MLVDSSAPNIPPRPPRREELARARPSLLRRGSPRKPDLWRVDLGRGPMVVKDYRGKRPLTRLLGRLQIRRELRAYRWVGRLPGIPRLIGRVDAHALALELIEGMQLAKAPSRIARGGEYLRGIREVMERLHAAGLVHLDLRSNKNVILRNDGSVVLVDLASAVRFRPGSLAHRLVFPWLQINDLSGYLKWKETLEAGEFSEPELRLLRRHRRLRSLWFLNRKRR